MEKVNPRFVYGPVPSRRLGRSLGVSPIPAKTCSYSCVYCQLGRTDRRRITRDSFYPRENILQQIVECQQVGPVDYVTFVGDGEPTLCQDLGWLIRQTKSKLNLPVAVITNGSLLVHEDVRTDLAAADVVMPSLDAGAERSFRAINRPHKDLSFAAIVEGQIEFRQEYTGQIWSEVMLVHGLNDSERELQHIQHTMALIKPDRVYIMSPIRPPAEAWVNPPPLTTIIQAQHIISDALPITDYEPSQLGTMGYSNAEQAILEIGSRHPLRRDQAEVVELTFEAPGTIERMLAGRQLIPVRYQNEEFVLPRHLGVGG